VMHDGMPYGRNQGQGQGHSREVDRQSPTGLIFFTFHGCAYPKLTWGLPTLSLTTNSSCLPRGGLPCLSSALWCRNL